MFEGSRASRATDAAAVGARWCVDTVRALDADGSEADLVDLLTMLEQIKAAAAAAQALAAEALDRAVRARHAAAGVPAAECGRGVAAQVALARHEAPSQGSRHLGLATALVREMPHTHAALRAGHLSEWRATILVRETACLTREHRGVVDAELCADPRSLAGVGDRALGNRARTIAYRLDAEAVLRRAGNAERDRRVTLRPAPDVMSHLSALMPVTLGVATYAALKHAADQARAAGDTRTLGQLMADTLVERVTGRSVARAVPIEVQLVITDRALLAGDREPAHLPGYGPVPASWARDLLRPNGLDADPADPAEPAAASSSPVTRPAARPGATPPSARPTTPPATPSAVRPPPPTAKACVRRATTPKKHLAGPPSPARDPHPTPTRSP